METHEQFMREAFKLAKQAADLGDYPIGALVVKDGRIIAQAHDKLKLENDSVNGHAEIGAIRQAHRELEQSYLQGCVLYTTHEPCPMCAAAAFWAKINTVVYSVSREDMIEEMEKGDEKFSWRQIAIPAKEIFEKGSGHRVELIEGLLKEEGRALFKLTK